jgi:TolA-binding protein
MRVAGFLFALLLAATPARAETIKIALLPFDNALGPKMAELAAAMPDILTACLTPHSDAVQVLERGMLEGLTGEQALQYGTALTKGEKPLRPGGLAAASHILRGSLAPHDAGFSLNLMLYDLATQALVASAEAQGGPHDATDVSCRAAKRLVEKLPDLKNPDITTPTVPADEAGHWIEVTEAMGFYYSGAFEKSIASFMRLAKEHPDDGAMRYWLAMSYLKAGMKDLAEVEFRLFLEKFPRHVRAPEARGELKKLVAEQGKAEEKKP